MWQSWTDLLHFRQDVLRRELAVHLERFLILLTHRLRVESGLTRIVYEGRTETSILF